MIQPKQKTTTYQRTIMERFMTADELNMFHEKYKSFSRKAKRAYNPSDLDIETIKKWLDGEYNTRRAAAIMGCSGTTVASRAGQLMKKGLIK